MEFSVLNISYSIRFLLLNDNHHLSNFTAPAAAAARVTFELLVVFVLHEPWSGVVENLCKSKLFTERPNYSTIVEAVGELFVIELYCYTLKGVTTRSKYDLSESNCVISQDVEVHIIPRFYQLEFHISSWATDYSRWEVQKICKKRAVAGSVLRDNVNSILVTISHPEKEHADVVYEELKEFADRKNGFIDDDQTIARWCHGTLDPVVKVHKGTAKRCDSFKSWEDEDAKSGSTYFNAPNPLRMNSQYYKKFN